jgi:uncharacterized membrane protein YraQ (UPF0718 family)
MDVKLSEAIRKTFNNIKESLPIILGVIFLIGLFTSLLSKEFYSSIFTGNNLIDSFFGAVIGSIAAGSPITSYVIGGELLEMSVSLIAVTAFILAWVTVGLLQFPAESLLLGKKFALTRNIISFIFAIIISILSVFTLGWIA